MLHSVSGEDNQAQVQSNINALLEIQPTDIPYTEIGVNLGATGYFPQRCQRFFNPFNQRHSGFNSSRKSGQHRAMVTILEWKLLVQMDKTKWALQPKSGELPGLMWWNSPNVRWMGDPRTLPIRKLLTEKKINVTNFEETQLQIRKLWKSQAIQRLDLVGVPTDGNDWQEATTMKNAPFSDPSMVRFWPYRTQIQWCIWDHIKKMQFGGLF